MLSKDEKELKGRKISILVRHRIFNIGRGTPKIVLQRKSGLFRRYRDWILLNEELYGIDNELNELTFKIKDLIRQRKEAEEFLKQQEKEVNQSVDETRGLSTAFPMKVLRSDLPFKKHKWEKEPECSWKKDLNPKLLKTHGQATGQGKQRETTRDKLGLEETAPRLTTAYTPEELKSFSYSLEEELDVDSVMTFHEDKNQSNRNKKNRNNNNRNNHNNNNNNNNDD